MKSIIKLFVIIILLIVSFSLVFTAISIFAVN